MKLQVFNLTNFKTREKQKTPAASVAIEKIRLRAAEREEILKELSLAGIIQQDVATESGADPSAVSRWFSGLINNKKIELTAKRMLERIRNSISA